MSDLLNLDLLDVDGAIRDSAEAAGLDRSDFLKRGVLAGGGLIAGAAFFSQLGIAEAKISVTRKSAKNDVKILNYALTLEYLESAFYAEAVANKAYGTSAVLKSFATTVAKHEAAHVSFLKGALKSAAVKKPKFDFGDATSAAKFAATAQVLEDTGVSAYLGQVKHIFVPGTLQAAATIATVEARHAGWIRNINAALGAPKSFDVPRSEAATLKVVGSTKFIK